MLQIITEQTLPDNDFLCINDVLLDMSNNYAVYRQLRMGRREPIPGKKDLKPNIIKMLLYTIMTIHNLHVIW